MSTRKSQKIGYWKVFIGLGIYKTELSKIISENYTMLFLPGLLL